jgi:hypothetical protein
MPRRRSDVIEIIAERALVFGLGGLVSLAIAAVLYAFKGEGYTIGLIGVLAVGGALAVYLSLYSAFEIRKVKRFDVVCPYCQCVNPLAEAATDDVLCSGCDRLIPILDGKVLQVQQVRCGYCNELNYYSDKTEFLICEKCEHEVPIASTNEFSRHVPKGFVTQEDNSLYELVLVAPGNRTEEVISTLQHMLALNRSQVKQILTDAPVTLLTGITRRKAEMLQAQLSVHDASSEFRALK